MPSLLNQISIVNGKLVQFDDMLVKYASSISVTPTPTPEPTPVPPPEPPEPPFDPLNPLGLPPFTIRCKFEAGYPPTMGTSQKCVDEVENVWDITNTSDDWTGLFEGKSALIEILGANTTSVTNLNRTFHGCSNLVKIALFDTSSVTTMFQTFDGTHMTEVPLFNTASVTSLSMTFQGCTKLTKVPLIDTSSATDMMLTFAECSSVETGALALYQQASGQSIPPSNHYGTFARCGNNTETGRAELQQIPNDWKD